MLVLQAHSRTRTTSQSEAVLSSTPFSPLDIGALQHYFGPPPTQTSSFPLSSNKHPTITVKPLNLLLHNRRRVVATAHNLHHAHRLQVLHQRRHHAVRRDALHLVASAQLSVATAAELRLTPRPNPHHEHTTLVVHHRAVTAARRDLRDAVPLQRVDRVGDVRVHLLLVRRLTLQTLAPRVHVAVARQRQHVVLSARDLHDRRVLEDADLRRLVHVARALTLTQLTVVVRAPSSHASTTPLPGVHLAVLRQRRRGLHARRDGDHALALQTLHALRSAQAAVLAAHAARLVVAPREHLAVLRQRDGVDVARAHLHLPLTARLLPYEAVSLQALHLLRTTRLLHSAGETHHDPSLVTQTTERGAAPRPHGAVDSHGSHVTVAHRAVDHRLTVEGVLDLARQDLVGAVLRVSLAQLVAVSLAERPQTTSLGDHGGG